MKNEMKGEENRVGKSILLIKLGCQAYGRLEVLEAKFEQPVGKHSVLMLQFS